MVLTLLASNQTQGSAVTVPNTDTAIATQALSNNAYRKIIITATVTMKAAATATQQTVNLKIKGGSTALVTLPIANEAVLQHTSSHVVRTIVELRAAQSITVTVGAAAADANTSVRFQTLTIEAES